MKKNKDKKWYAIDKDNNILDSTWSSSSVGATQKFETSTGMVDRGAWERNGKKVVTIEEFKEIFNG